jgi:hypothetical protein
MFVHTITTAVSVIASLAKTKSVEKKRKLELFGPNPALAILRSIESGVVGPYLA